MSGKKPRIGATFVLLIASAPLVCSNAFGHQGESIGPDDFWTAWELEPGIVISLILSGWLYLRGVRALWRTCGRGVGIQKWEAAAYTAGWAWLAIALASPLHPLGESLFSAHMAQHEILMIIAAPLLVLGRPLIAFLWALPMSWRRALGRIGRPGALQSGWRTLTNVTVAWCLQAAILWVWHIPRFYDASITSEWVHAAQHLCFLGSALLFWWALIHGREGRMGYGAATFYVFATAAHSSALGALLTFAPTVWYPAYLSTTAQWGLTTLQDQQLAGLLMWVPTGVIYLVAGLMLFAGWLNARGPDHWPGVRLKSARSLAIEKTNSH